MAIEYGINRTDDKHALSLITTDDGVITNSSVKLGRRVSTAFDLVIAPAPSALPSTAKFRSGFALDANDCIYATQTEPSTKLYSFGVATRLDGAVWITTSNTVPMKEIFHPLLGFAMVSQTGALYAGGFFGLPLSDSGSGAVDTSGFLSGAATFTRATAAAARLSTGLWKLDVASGVARSHYHEFTAGTMTYGGYLAELAATQLALLPRDMTNAAWVKGATITVAQTGTGIDGVANSCTRVTAGAVEATNTVLQTLTAAASSRTYSAWIKRVTGTGTVAITQDGVSYTDITSQLNTTTFVQVQLNASQLNASFGIRMTTSTDVILVDCNQFEAGTYATTPIPAAGTRNADVLTYAASVNLSASSGTSYAEIASTWPSGSGPGVPVVLATDLNGRILYNASSPGAATTLSIRDGTNTVTSGAGTSFSTGIRKAASSWGTAGMSIVMTGSTVGTGSFDGAMSVANPIGIGGRGDSPANNFSGTIKNLKIWQTQRNDIQAMAA